MDTVLKNNKTAAESIKEYESVHIEKTKKTCGLCENFSQSKAAQDDLIAVISCEGACLRGEVSRRTANKLCFEELPDKTARVCLGSAFTKDSGQRNMIRSAEKVIILEGCFIDCASRMMKAVIPDLEASIIHVDRHYRLNKNLFAINEASEAEITAFSDQATESIKRSLQ